MSPAANNQTPSVETIIGLEVHVQLLTDCKLFCGCPTTFGAPANTQVCEICTGMPGSLPVINEYAIQLAIKTGLALDCQIARYTKWDRKNYFYPDLPKGYQISQYDQPLCAAGRLAISDPNAAFPDRIVRIQRAHLEEDAGKSLHDESSAGGQSLIDLNRCGTPLLEIVTDPDLRSGAEAKAFLSELKLLLSYLKVSDCNMQQGSLRVDANVNLHIRDGGQLFATPIVEVKNMNSFRAAERALDFEAARQLADWQTTGLTIRDAPKQTRGWDETRQETVAQRAKEESSDYRYFPDPDLAAVVINDRQIESLRQEIDQLPAPIRRRLIEQYQITAYSAQLIVNQGRGVVDYFGQVADQLGDGKLAANWIGQDVLRYLNEHNTGIDSFPVSAERLSALLDRVKSNQLNHARARDVLAKMIESPISVEQAIEELGIRPTRAADIEQLSRRLLAQNPDVVQQIKNGKTKAIGALIGQARQLDPNANPALIRAHLLKLINASK